MNLTKIEALRRKNRNSAFVGSARSFYFYAYIACYMKKNRIGENDIMALYKNPLTRSLINAIRVFNPENLHDYLELGEEEISYIINEYFSRLKSDEDNDDINAVLYRLIRTSSPKTIGLLNADSLLYTVLKGAEDAKVFFAGQKENSRLTDNLTSYLYADYYSIGQEESESALLKQANDVLYFAPSSVSDEEINEAAKAEESAILLRNAPNSIVPARIAYLAAELKLALKHLSENHKIIAFLRINELQKAFAEEELKQYIGNGLLNSIIQIDEDRVICIFRPRSEKIRVLDLRRYMKGGRRRFHQEYDVLSFFHSYRDHKCLEISKDEFIKGKLVLNPRFLIDERRSKSQKYLPLGNIADVLSSTEDTRSKITESNDVYTGQSSDYLIENRIIDNDGYIDFRKAEPLKDVPEALRRSELQEDDLYIISKSTRIKVGIFLKPQRFFSRFETEKRETEDRHFYLVSGSIIIRIRKNSKVPLYYLLAYLYSEEGKKLLYNKASNNHSKSYQLSAKRVRSLPIPLLSEEEMNEIATNFQESLVEYYNFKSEYGEELLQKSNELKNIYH